MGAAGRGRRWPGGSERHRHRHRERERHRELKLKLKEAAAAPRRLSPSGSGVVVAGAAEGAPARGALSRAPGPQGPRDSPPVNAQHPCPVRKGMTCSAPRKAWSLLLC